MIVLRIFNFIFQSQYFDSAAQFGVTIQIWLEALLQYYPDPFDIFCLWYPYHLLGGDLVSYHFHCPKRYCFLQQACPHPPLTSQFGRSVNESVKKKKIKKYA